jgi:hypothetical protein
MHYFSQEIEFKENVCDKMVDYIQFLRSHHGYTPEKLLFWFPEYLKLK